MSILVNSSTRVITQGMTGKTGAFHTRACRAYANPDNFVAGVNPRKAGTDMDGIPIYGTVAEAKAATGANASVIYVPPAGAAAAILEAVEAELDLVVCITEMKIGIMPGHICRKGRIGVVSRSGTLTYEAVAQLTDLGLGQSTAVGIGGDPVNGLKHVDVLKLFNEDPETDAVVMIGEIGGSDEEIAAQWARDNMTKPVVGFIAGVTAPVGKRMGHAGAIIDAGRGTAEEKIRVLNDCGIRTTRDPSEIGKLLASVL